MLGILPCDFKKSILEINLIYGRIPSMDATKLYRGQALKLLVDNPKPKREAIADGFIYEKSVLMFAAAPGCGKSILTLQTAMSLSCGEPVFGMFRVNKPHVVYYLQRERPKEEILERIELMQKVNNWNPDNFILDDSTQGLNFVNPKHSDFLIRKIKNQSPSVIIPDPIYAGHGDLRDGQKALEICHFLTKLQAETGATIIINHHTVKDNYDYKGNKIKKDDPFYGSQFIKAYVTGYYTVERGGKGILLENMKDSHSNMMKRFELEFDSEHFVLRGTTFNMPLRERLILFINDRFEKEKGFTFNELKHHLGVSDSHIRNTLSDTLFSKNLKNVSPLGQKAYYKPTSKI